MATPALAKSRPKQHDDHSNLNTRARLLRAATVCFSRSGFEGTSMREIAETANVAQQLITYHFGTKEDLWAAAVRQLHEEFLRTMEGLHFDVSLDLTEQFLDHQRTVFRDRIDRPHIARIWTQEFLAGRPRFEKTLLPLLEEFGRHVANPYFDGLVSRGVASGFTTAEVSLVCNALLQLNVLNPFLVEGALGKPANSPEAIEQQVQLLARILTRGPADVVETEGEQGQQHAEETAELKLVIAELTLENRRLRQTLEASRGASAAGE
jgi:TetR/AcrR family transcriptional regulator